MLTNTSAIAQLARIDTLLIDKTGTLTVGEPRLIKVDICSSHPVNNDIPAADAANRSLRVAAALEAHSDHPIARAIRQAYVSDGQQTLPSAQSVELIAGCGLRGEVDGQRFILGSTDFVARELQLSTLERRRIDDLGDEYAPNAEADSLLNEDIEHGRIVLADLNGPLAVFQIADGLVFDAPSFIARVKAMNVRPVMVSGDNEQAVKALAQALSIEESHAQTLPDDKRLIAQRLTEQGKVVGMLGDGVNDAPVIACADVSIAVRAGAALARVKADAILLGDGLNSVCSAIELARRVRRVIQQNLWWALGYNAVALPLAAMGWIPPWLAAIGMSLSSLLVVANSARIRLFEAESSKPSKLAPTRLHPESSALVARGVSVGVEP